MSTWKKIEIESLGSESKELIGKKVQEQDQLEVFRPNTAISRKGEPLVIYGRIPMGFSTSNVRAVLRNMKFNKVRRLTQYVNKTEVTHTFDMNFGFNPPNRIFGTGAGACLFNSNHPSWYAEIVALGKEVAKEYKKTNPERHKFQTEFMAKHIRPEWQIPGTPYTQGVVNDSNMLGYHYDRDNVEGGWSCMVYFGAGVEGGNLVVPALKGKFLFEDRTYMLFDGQSLMHGVTPIKKTREDGYRYSIVYYARKSMIGLGSIEEERRKSNEIEFKKHKKNMENLV